jgi:hypothetical protein
MIPKIIEAIKYALNEYRFYFLSIAFLLGLLIYNYNENLALEKRLRLIDKQLYMNKVTFERRQKAYDEKAKQQKEKLQRRLKEIKIELNKNSN